MPLPGNDQKWPPAELAPILDVYATYDAWITGDTKALTGIYATGAGYAKGFNIGPIGVFWGKQDPSGNEVKMHAPLASDICRVNSDLLFSDPITATVAVEDDAEPDTKTQERLDLILESAHTVFVGAAELSSGLGGTFLRATWDTAVHDHAFITKVDADLAWPTFRWGRLTAVTFWRVLAEENATVWRHLECHELDAAGIGVIRHGLYEGTKDQLGIRRPYQDRTETAWLASQPLIDGDTISTGTEGLDVEYVRNLEQSKVWRKHPLGAHLGRSDLEGLLGDLDAYDKTYTSLMRDLEDGKSRLLVAESMLRSNGPGQGAVFQDSSLFTGLNAAPGSVKDAGLPIEQVQFKIRVDEHLSIMEDILHRIVRSAGYSPRSFGLAGEDGGDKTATEVSSEDSLSQQTRKRKIRAWEPAIERLLRKCLAIDAVLLNGGGDSDPKIDVQFASASRQDPLVLAQIVQTLRNAKAASTKTLVEIAHPDWDKDTVDEEVKLIMAEDELPPVADPDDRPPGAELDQSRQ
jgi:hypothetical protein